MLLFSKRPEFHLSFCQSLCEVLLLDRELKAKAAVSVDEPIFDEVGDCVELAFGAFCFFSIFSFFLNIELFLKVSFSV